MKEIYENFKQNLAYLRKNKSWTQEDLAQQLGIKRTVVASYEAGNTLPKFDVLLEIGKIFNVSLERLLLAKSPKELFVNEEQENFRDKERIKKLQGKLIEAKQNEAKALKAQAQLKDQVNDLSIKLNGAQAELLEFYKKSK